MKQVSLFKGKKRKHKFIFKLAILIQLVKVIDWKLLRRKFLFCIKFLNDTFYLRPFWSKLSGDKHLLFIILKKKVFLQTYIKYLTCNWKAKDVTQLGCTSRIYMLLHFLPRQFNLEDLLSQCIIQNDSAAF